MKSAQIPIGNWIVGIIIALVGFAILAYLMLSGILPKSFTSILGQLKGPSL